jgi:hypothetical protein
MQNIAGKITIGNSTLRLGKNSRIVALDVQSALSIPAHRSQIVADAASGITAKPGDVVKVELGYDAQVNRIFTGRVHSLAARADPPPCGGAQRLCPAGGSTHQPGL